MGTEYGTDASGYGGVAVGNKANGVGGVGAGDTTNGGVGAGKASFVLKTSSSIALRINDPMRNAVRAKLYLSSSILKNLSRIRFLKMFYCTRAKIP
jgi:hypothetical protein